MNLWQHKIEENKWEVTQWATNPDSLAGLQSSLVAESKIEHWHSELRCWLLTPGNLGFKMAPDPRRRHLGKEGGGRLFVGKVPFAALCVQQCFGWDYDVGGGVREDAGAIRDWLLSLSKASSWVEVKERRTGSALPVCQRPPAVRCSFTPWAFSTPGCLPDTSGWRDQKSSAGLRRPTVLGRRSGTSTNSLITCGCHLKFNTTQMRSTCPSYWWPGTAQGAGQQMQTDPKPCLVILHARDSSMKT